MTALTIYGRPRKKDVGVSRVPGAAIPNPNEINLKLTARIKFRVAYK